MSKNLKNKIDYKVPTEKDFDSDGLAGCLADEYGMFEAGSVKLPADYVRVKKVKTIDKDGNIKPLVFRKPKGMTPQKIVKQKYPNAKDMYCEGGGHAIMWWDEKQVRYTLSYGSTSAKAWCNAMDNIKSKK